MALILPHLPARCPRAAIAHSGIANFWMRFLLGLSVDGDPGERLDLLPRVIEHGKSRFSGRDLADLPPRLPRIECFERALFKTESGAVLLDETILMQQRPTLREGQLA